MDKLTQIERDLQSLKDAFYKNNFSNQQDFNKSVSFNSKLKVPHFSALPSTCEVGEIGEYSGKLYICSAANTWSLVGTQT